MSAVLHLDGCHFYVWLDDIGRLTYDERTGDNLMLHRSDEPCERCTALARGTRPVHHEARLATVPDDSKALMAAVFKAIVEIQAEVEA